MHQHRRTSTEPCGIECGRRTKCRVSTTPQPMKIPKPVPKASRSARERSPIRVSIAEQASARRETTRLSHNAWPEVHDTVDLDDGFATWLRQQNNLKEPCILPAIEAVRRFLGLLCVNGLRDRTTSELLVALYEDDVQILLVKTDGQRSSSSNHISRCRRNKDKRPRMYWRVLGTWSEKAQEHHWTPCGGRKLRDAERIADMAAPGGLRYAAVQAICDIKAVHGAFREAPGTPNGAPGRANVAPAGVIYLCYRAGRGGEWVKVKWPRVRHKLSVVADHLV